MIYRTTLQHNVSPSEAVEKKKTEYDVSPNEAVHRQKTSPTTPRRRRDGAVQEGGECNVLHVRIHAVPEHLENAFAPMSNSPMLTTGQLSQRSCNCAEILDEPPVEVAESQEPPNLCD